MRLCAFTETFSSTHLCCTVCAYDCFLLLSLANGGREGENSWLLRQYLERQVAAETSHARAVSIKKQLQKPTTERVQLADLHAELWSHLSLLGNWQADQITCIICTPTLREVIMAEIVCIIIEFLR